MNKKIAQLLSNKNVRDVLLNKCDESIVTESVNTSSIDNALKTIYRLRLSLSSLDDQEKVRLLTLLSDVIMESFDVFVKYARTDSNFRAKFLNPIVRCAKTVQEISDNLNVSIMQNPQEESKEINTQSILTKEELDDKVVDSLLDNGDVDVDVDGDPEEERPKLEDDEEETLRDNLDVDVEDKVDSLLATVNNQIEVKSQKEKTREEINKSEILPSKFDDTTVDDVVFGESKNLKILNILKDKGLF